MERKLEDLTVLELKAFAYDQMIQLEQAQNNLRVLNQELVRRAQLAQQTSQTQSLTPTESYIPNASESLVAGSIQRI